MKLGVFQIRKNLMEKYGTWTLGFDPEGAVPGAGTPEVEVEAVEAAFAGHGREDMMRRIVSRLLLEAN